MSHKIKITKTAEQRRAEAEALHASIADQVDQLHNSEAWMRFLHYAEAFHAYSLNNVLLILAQYPNASRVAGFRKWQELARQVRKGQRGIKIFGYREKKVTEPNDERPDQAQTHEETIKDAHRCYFPVLSVFDISQTDPIDPDADDPSTLAHRLTGDDPIGIVTAITDHLTEQGWTLTREPPNGRATDTPRQTVTVSCSTTNYPHSKQLRRPSTKPPT
jgi:hypothetical protein